MPDMFWFPPPEEKVSYYIYQFLFVSCRFCPLTFCCLTYATCNRFACWNVFVRFCLNLPLRAPLPAVRHIPPAYHQRPLWFCPYYYAFHHTFYLPLLLEGLRPAWLPLTRFPPELPATVGRLFPVPLPLCHTVRHHGLANGCHCRRLLTQPLFLIVLVRLPPVHAVNAVHFTYMPRDSRSVPQFYRVLSYACAFCRYIDWRRLPPDWFPRSVPRSFVFT